jgi:hypothetical protein
MIAALATAAALAGATASDDGTRRLAELQHMYQQSCEVRAYGSFDDLCDELKKQIRAAQKAHRTAAGARPQRGGAPQPVAAAPSGD